MIHPKVYLKTFFLHFFTTGKKKLFILFISKKDLIFILKVSMKRFLRDNYIPTLVYFILKHEPCKKNGVVNPFFIHPACCCCIVNLLENV